MTTTHPHTPSTDLPTSILDFLQKLRADGLIRQDATDRDLKRYIAYDLGLAHVHLHLEDAAHSIVACR